MPICFDKIIKIFNKILPEIQIPVQQINDQLQVLIHSTNSLLIIETKIETKYLPCDRSPDL